MNSENQQWQKLKNNYLKQIEKSLAQVDHPQRAEILANVREHLDNKYTELYPEQQNWESFQQIITEMGPPEEYAELLCEEIASDTKKRLYITERLVIIFLAALIGIVFYLIYTAQKTPAPTPKIAEKAFEFELDERALGKWATVDFVKRIDDFDPSKKRWQGDLFLKELAFKTDGALWWTNKDGGPYKHHWTKGKVDPLKERPAFYYLRNINGQTYLFYEWISGDVTDRGREPSYYVLKRASGDESTLPSWFENDAQAIGYWVSVDFVNNIEDFQPGEQKQTTELFLKTLHFEDTGKIWWTVGKSKPISLDWTKGEIRPFGIWPAAYSIKQLDNIDYLFYKYQTRHSHAAGYYVFKQMPQPEPIEQTEDKPFENDPRVLGEWITVDFVETIDQFEPNQPSWKGNLFVKSLHFKAQGTAEWCFGEDQMKIDHHWTKGILNPDDDLPAQYIIKKYNDGDYLFMEWNSGDVTIRGQKPSYYVLSQNPENVEFNISKPSIQIVQTPLVEEPSVLGKWIAVDCVKNTDDFNLNQRQYKKQMMLSGLHFASPGTVYWNFRNDTVKQTSFGEFTAESVMGQPAKYFIKTVDGDNFLFIEWITLEVAKQGKAPCYYVLKQSSAISNENEFMKSGAINSFNVVGRWISVDFVRNIEDFRPQKKQWAGDLYLKDLTFFENGNTSGLWTWKQNYLWHPGDRTKANFTIQEIQGATYLFMEWMSGDVTTRGQKPAYYVLKKTHSPSNPLSRNRKITFGANYCTANYVRSILGSPSRIDMNGRMLRYSNFGLDLLFSRNGPLSEAHLNRGYKGELETGISLASSKHDVFITYGQPTRTVQTDKLSGRNDDRILYQKGNTSRIYYGRKGLIFWFRDNAINQIVVFKGTMFLN